MTLTQIVIVGIAAVACVIDLRERRIPNWLTLGAALGGLVYQVTVAGTAQSVSAPLATARFERGDTSQ